MINFARLATDLNIKPLLEILKVSEQAFNETTERQSSKNSPHVHTKVVVLRGPSEKTQESHQESIEAINYEVDTNIVEEVESLLRPILQALSVKELGYIMITSLKAGESILPHEDQGVYARYYNRYHIPLYSEEGNTFTCGEETVSMQEGDLWIFNHLIEHTVINNSNQDRLHLIFDATTKE